MLSLAHKKDTFGDAQYRQISIHLILYIKDQFSQNIFRKWFFVLLCFWAFQFAFDLLYLFAPLVGPHNEGGNQIKNGKSFFYDITICSILQFTENTNFPI